MLSSCGAEEDSWQSPLDSTEVKPVNSKENEPWLFIGRTDAEASILWPPGAKSWLIGKDPDAGKDWKQKEKRVAEDEMVGWHHRFNGQNLRKLWDIVKDREAWGAEAHREVKIEHDLVTEQQQVEASCPTS